ncbi:MAG: hypothetical protein ABI778_03735, partial [Ignavibacteriota bacterium]
MAGLKKTFTANPSIPIGQLGIIAKSYVSSKWVSENTAFLIIHGIGNQNPLETLDQFGRGFIHAYAEKLHCEISDFTISHEVAVKHEPGGSTWFDNFVRIAKPGESFHIDLYEYYWANQTQDKASIHQIQVWINDVVRQAKRFYEENVTMQANAADRKFAKKSDEKDSVSNERKVKFSGLRYKSFLLLIGLALPAFNFILKFPRWIGDKNIPVLSSLACLIAGWWDDTISSQFANVVGDIVIYNTSDAKSSFYEVRRNILAGAVQAVRYLIEPPEKESCERLYGRVILAGHSLGTQIAYDAINRINHLINFEAIRCIGKDGVLLDEKGNPDPEKKQISSILCGLVTFGSPLDKIAFFLREHVHRENSLMLQIINDYHSFRQRDWYDITGGSELDIHVKKTITRLFENIPWRNYYDKRDYVSGSLDYYDDVLNVDCGYATNPIMRMRKGVWTPATSGKLSFTHSWYWSNEAMFKDII